MRLLLRLRQTVIREGTLCCGHSWNGKHCFMPESVARQQNQPPCCFPLPVPGSEMGGCGILRKGVAAKGRGGRKELVCLGEKGACLPAPFLQLRGRQPSSPSHWAGHWGGDISQLKAPPILKELGVGVRKCLQKSSLPDVCNVSALMCCYATGVLLLWH